MKLDLEQARELATKYLKKIEGNQNSNDTMEEMEFWLEGAKLLGNRAPSQELLKDRLTALFTRKYQAVLQPNPTLGSEEFYVFTYDWFQETEDGPKEVLMAGGHPILVDRITGKVLDLVLDTDEDSLEEVVREIEKMLERHRKPEKNT